MFSEKLKEELTRRRWRAATLYAAILDVGGDQAVSRAAVYNWTRGTKPTFGHVCLILRALGIADADRPDWMRASGYSPD